MFAYDIAESEFISPTRLRRLSCMEETKILFKGRLVGILPVDDSKWSSLVCEKFKTIVAQAEKTYISKKVWFLN